MRDTRCKIHDIIHPEYRIERIVIMKTTKKKVSDITVDELKTIIHDIIAEDLEILRETIEIMSDKKLMRKIKQADKDWLLGEKDAYISWEDIKRV